MKYEILFLAAIIGGVWLSGSGGESERLSGGGTGWQMLGAMTPFGRIVTPSAPTPTDTKKETKQTELEAAVKGYTAALGDSKFNVTTSSTYDHSSCNTPSNYILNSGNNLGWCAENNNANQWIMIDAGEKPVMWKAIATQGRPGPKQWVKSYNIMYTLNDIDWETYNRGNLEGNKDDSTLMYHIINIEALKIKLIPVTWNEHISMRIEAYYQEILSEPDDDSIPALAVSDFHTARSSTYNHRVCNTKWKLNVTAGYAWCAKTNNQDQFFEIGGGKGDDPVHWVMIATQGRGKHNQYVKTYKISYTMNGLDWGDYEGGKEFTANNHQSTIKYNMIDINALKIRIIPLSWNRHISMRVEAYYKPIGEY